MGEDEVSALFMTRRTPQSETPSARRAGFSILEMLVTMAIVSILAGLGFVSLPRDRFAAREAARVLAADMNRARSEAIRLNTNVALDFGGVACVGGDYCLYTDPDRAGLEPDGDLDADGSPDPGFQPALLRRDVAAEFPRATLTASGMGTDNAVWFDVRGLPRTKTGGYASDVATIVVRPRGADAGFVVTLEPQGRVQVTAE